LCSTDILIDLHPPEFLEAIRSVNPKGRWKILVVDEHSQKLLNAVLKQFDILEENVTRTHRSCRHLPPAPDAPQQSSSPSPAIESRNLVSRHCTYLCPPLRTSIESYEISLVNGSMPVLICSSLKVRLQPYSSCNDERTNHIAALSETLFQKLTSSPAEPNLIGLKELYLNFSGAVQARSASSVTYALLAVESQLFSLNMPELFFSIFSPPRGEAAARGARDRLEEDLRFVSRVVRPLPTLHSISL
jgi:syntaxin-binding protein 1